MAVIVDVDRDYQISLLQIAECVSNGELAIIPTDTIYGIVGSFDIKTIDKIFDAKRRPGTKPIAIMTNMVSALNDYISFHNNHLHLIEKYLPGQITVVGYSKINISDSRIVLDGKVGVRIPNYRLCYDLVRICKSPLLLTSANLSSLGDIYSVAKFPKEILNKVGIIGKTAYIIRKPSTVVDISEESLKIIRQGAIDLG